MSKQQAKTANNTSVLSVCKQLWNCARSKSGLWFALASAALPMLFLLCVYVLRGIVLRGEASLFYASLEPSLLTQIASAKESIGGHSLFSVSAQAAGFDPFLLLAALLPFSLTGSAVIASLVRVGLLGLFFYASMRCLRAKPFASLCGSALYALSAYGFVSSLFAGASTVLLMLPLLVCALVILLEHGFCGGLGLVVALSWLMDTRAGFLMTLFAVGLFFYFYLTGEDRPSLWAPLAKLGGAIAVAFVVGLLPFLYSIGFFEPTTFEWEYINLDLLSFFAKMLPSVSDGLRPDGYPYLWCGLLPLLLAPAFFASSHISKRKRVGTAIALVALFVTMLFSWLDHFFDLFGRGALPVFAQTPLWIFLLVYLGVSVLSLDTRQDSTSIYVACGVLTVLIAVMQRVGMTYSNADGTVVDLYLPHIRTVWFSILALVCSLFAVISYLGKKEGKRKVCALLLLGAVGLEMIVGNVALTKTLAEQYKFYSRDDLSSYEKAYQTALDVISEYKEDLYRNEISNSFAPGQSTLLGYNGISSPMVDQAYAQFLAKMGFDTEGTAVAYTHGNLPLDSLFSIAFLASYYPPVEEEIEESEDKPGKIKQLIDALFPEEKNTLQPYAPNVSLSSYYDAVYGENGVTIRENSYALPLLFSSATSLKDLDFSVPTEEDLIYDEFLGSYSLPTSFLEMEQIYYTPVERIHAIYEALTGVSDIALYKTLKESIGVAPTVNVYYATRTYDSVGHVIYTSTGSDPAKARLSISIQMDVGRQVFLTLPAIVGREAKVYVNSEYIGTINENDKADNSLLNLGYVSEGKLTVDVYFGQNSEKSLYLLKDYDYLYTVDDAAFVSLMNHFDHGSISCEKQTDKSLTATVIAPQGRTAIFTSIPYSSSIRVEVDGQKVETYPICDALLGFELPSSGSHTVSITVKGEREQPGLFALSLIAFIAICGTIALETYLYFKKKRHG